MINNVEEEFLYRLMSMLYSMNIPIVFKGALVLKVVQYQYGNPAMIERETHDLDGDWVGSTPSMEYLTSVLQTAVNNLGYNVRVEAYRDYGDRKSAGFNFIRRDTGDLFTTMDLSIRSNSCLQLYSFIDGITFCGQSINKIIVDKISVCASRSIFRRIKDIIDLYILSYCWNGYSKDLVELSIYLSKSFSDLSRLTDYYNELEHAYSKYKNKASVLPFSVVHSRVVNFLLPFINKCTNNYYWDGNNWNLCEGRTKIWN